MVNLTGITLSNSRPQTAIFHIIPKFNQRKALFCFRALFQTTFCNFATVSANAFGHLGGATTY